MSDAETRDPYAFHAVVLAYGATREELAAALAEKASEILAGEGDYRSVGSDGVLLVKRSDDHGGEASLSQRLYMVFMPESDSGEPAIAMFRDRRLADRVAAGESLFEKGDGLGSDLGVARVDVVGTWWNSVDPDQTEF